MSAEFRVGDVVRYTSERGNNWCREGMAVAIEQRGGRVVLVDTYWNLSGGDDHILTADELATARLQFNTGDYDALDRYSRNSRATWATYAPDDRAMFTAQNGLQARYFIRKGAEPSLAQQIENACVAVADAEMTVRSAQSELDWRRRQLAELEAKVVTA